MAGHIGNDAAQPRSVEMAVAEHPTTSPAHSAAQHVEMRSADIAVRTDLAFAKEPTGDRQLRMTAASWSWPDGSCGSSTAEEPGILKRRGPGIPGALSLRCTTR